MARPIITKRKLNTADRKIFKSKGISTKDVYVEEFNSAKDGSLITWYWRKNIQELCGIRISSPEFIRI